MHGYVKLVAAVDEAERAGVFVAQDHQRGAGVDHDVEVAAVDLRLGDVMTGAVGGDANMAAIVVGARRLRAVHRRRGVAGRLRAVDEARGQPGGEKPHCDEDPGEEQRDPKHAASIGRLRQNAVNLFDSARDMVKNYFPRGFARRVGAAATGSSGQGCLG